jgi:hypothetical protein
MHIYNTSVVSTSLPSPRVISRTDSVHCRRLSRSQPIRTAFPVSWGSPEKPPTLLPERL